MTIQQVPKIMNWAVSIPQTHVTNKSTLLVSVHYDILVRCTST
jgi:hypothetical protein